ncbi:energy-coupling factor transporter transmembrane component T [Curtanaerobium respiraculi]|uniref:energy-coupling factor transporter transmembrane component T n=1 Tax=Curtanaerobium respiraculi TaxID=2949669 RepID=UPI0024B3B3C0|nr:energy-coupling factor transporter transmembrane component T [Curtanaerobium respiraculi]
MRSSETPLAENREHDASGDAALIDKMIASRDPYFDVRVKLIVLIAINVVAVMSCGIVVEIAVMAVILGALCYSRLFRGALASACSYATALLFMALAPGLPMAVGSVVLVLSVLLRTTTPIFAFALCLISTTKINELLVALHGLHVPRSITLPLSVILSYPVMLASECRNITRAMKMRGFGVNARNVVMHFLRTAEHIMVPIIVRSSTIADEISTAAITRGIEMEGRRSTFFDQRIRPADAALLLGAAGLVALAVWVKTTGMVWGVIA